MRGRAYSAAGQYALAEAEFRKIIDQPTATLEPLMANLPLAHLGLARALALEGNVAVSRKEYEKVFDLWKDAEPDLPALRLAKAEYASLDPEVRIPTALSSRAKNAADRRRFRF
jgi:tetratricopeptide (TPR) repeat protein